MCRTKFFAQSGHIDFDRIALDFMGKAVQTIFELCFGKHDLWMQELPFGDGPFPRCQLKGFAILAYFLLA